MISVTGTRLHRLFVLNYIEACWVPDSDNNICPYYIISIVYMIFSGVTLRSKFLQYSRTNDPNGTGPKLEPTKCWISGGGKKKRLFTGRNEFTVKF